MIGDLIDVLFMNKRSIGGVIPNVTIEEEHTDTLTITNHPVQSGASIVDHAFKNPAELVMQVGWSNSSSILTALVSGSLFGQGILDVNDIYKRMLELQEQCELLNVVTGKRTYKNMLIKQLRLTNTVDTENALILTVTLQQIIIVQVSTTTAGQTPLSSTPQSAQENPRSTAATITQGTRQPIPTLDQPLNAILDDLGIKV